MTTQEKAKQIATNNRLYYLEVGNDGDTHEVNSEFDCYWSAMDMAKWKDENFYRILACIKLSFEKQGIGGADKFIEDIKKQWGGISDGRRIHRPRITFKNSVEEGK